jgi:hypothetical protein
VACSRACLPLMRLEEQEKLVAVPTHPRPASFAAGNRECEGGGRFGQASVPAAGLWLTDFWGVLNIFLSLLRGLVEHVARPNARGLSV